MTIGEIKELLMEEPFSIPVEQEALLVARYMIEDEQTNRVVFDERASAEILVLVSVLNNLLGNYKVPTYQDD